MRAVIAVVLLTALSLGSTQSAPARPRITGISHVAFRVSDAAAARRFYGELLGLHEGASSRAGTIRFDVGSRQHVLLESGLAADAEERLSHLAFETTDIDALSSYLASRGISVRQPPERCEPSAIHVVDPDGHPIEFVQVTWPPPIAAVPHGRALSDRVLHAGLIVRAEDTAHRFYRDALGFSEIWRGGRTDDVTNWVNMRVPDGTDYLEYMLLAGPVSRQQRGTSHHLCLLVPDMQAAWEEVARRTAARATLSPPNVGRNGRWQLNLYDPDGTRTELMEPFRVR